MLTAPGRGVFGLSRFLHDHEVTVVEVDRPKRQNRRKVGKPDPTDAPASRIQADEM